MMRILARAWLLLFGVVTGAYALLAYLPFTYQAVIRFPMVSWIPAFVRLHPWLFLATLVWNLAVDRARLRSPWVRALYLAQGLLGVGMLIFPPLRAIRNDASSLVLALVFFLLPLGGILLDARSAWQARPWRPGASGEPRRLFTAALMASAFGALVFPALAWLRPGANLPLEPAALAWGWTLWANLVVYTCAACLLLGVLGLARLFRRPAVEPALLGFVLWLALGRFLLAVVFRPIAFQGAAALVVAGVLAGLGVASLLGAALGCPPREPATESALDLLLRPLAQLLRGSWPRGLAWLGGLACLAYLVLSRAALMDWNFLFQKTTVAVVGTLAFLGAYAALPPGKPVSGWIWAHILTPILAVNLFLAFDEAVAVPRGATLAELQAGSPLDHQAGKDVSLRLLREALAPLQKAKQTIYRVLQANSNLSREVRTDPVAIQHVDDLRPVPGPKPDIYVFVVDSLRRDYLGAYNPKVAFTPELDRFAAQGYAVPNAFTRYGATGLSEPSIWTGALMLHKQYITPFHPMNSLQKLLETDGYRGLISVDSILDVVVKPGPWMTPLDPGVGTQDLRLGATLDKLQAALAGRGQDPRPLFVYSQCQDIHISVINREGQSTVVPGEYGGFHGPYASRVRRLDAAFGKFIAFLKRQGRFENSLIIFTADHGDSLGEEGRFGHAYTLFPEIVRIPMLISLPAAMRTGVIPDREAPAFLTDLTPTLYYLLGHRPLRQDRALGRPLFTATAAEQAPYRQDHYLLASSYGAVFGILDGRGDNLYIADGVNYEDHLYRLDPGIASSKRNLPPAQKARYDQLILDDIAMLNRFYNFHPPR